MTQGITKSKKEHYANEVEAKIAEAIRAGKPLSGKEENNPKNGKLKKNSKERLWRF